MECKSPALSPYSAALSLASTSTTLKFQSLFPCTEIITPVIRLMCLSNEMVCVKALKTDSDIDGSDRINYKMGIC